MLAYWGRRGALTLFTHQLGKAALENSELETTISVSRQNEEYETYGEFGSSLFPIDTFQSSYGALLKAWSIPLIRKKLRDRIKRDGTQLVVELLPHIWSPLIMPVLRREGVKYAVIIHDAQRHPGDYRSIVNSWMKRSMKLADFVITLSDHVADQIRQSNPEYESKLITLFHPNLESNTTLSSSPAKLNKPLRLLFLGRIMKYKGLPLLVEAVEKLISKGHQIELGVFGEGNLEVSADKLNAIGAEVKNHWLSQTEISDALTRYHIMVLSHLEASQSGVLALAHGANMPVVSTPVGGITKQITDGINGLLAKEVSAPALADAIEKLIMNPELYSTIRKNINRDREIRSPKNFIQECLSQIARRQFE